MLKNVRIEQPQLVLPPQMSILLDAGYVGGTASNINIVLEGINDAYSGFGLVAQTPLIITGPGANISLRNSTVQRPVLAAEPGSVSSVSITNGGSYGPIPTVTFSAPPTGGTTAQGVALIGGIALGTSAITIGSTTPSYSAPPAVTFDPPPPGGTCPTAVATLNANGQVASVYVTFGGSGYGLSSTNIYFKGTHVSGWSAATSPTQVTGVQLTNAGSGYVTAPSITFSAGTAAATASLVPGDSPATSNQSPIGTAQPAILRVESLQAGGVGAICALLPATTKVDFTADPSLRVGVSTIYGRPRFSRLDWAILQLNPKHFWDLGDIGLVAPNRGYALINSAYPYGGSTYPYNDGQYSVGSPGLNTIQQLSVQNAQGVVQTDGIGAFNTLGSSWVSLLQKNSNGLGIAPASAGSVLSGCAAAIGLPGWTVFFILLRNSATLANHAIISNLTATTGQGGFEIRLDSVAGNIVATFDNGGAGGTNKRQTFTSNYTWTSTTQPLLGMLTVDPPGITYPYVRLYLCPLGLGAFADLNSLQYTLGGAGSGIYGDTASTPVPTIGSSPLNGVAKLSIARIATWDLVLPNPVATLQNLANMANSFGR